MCLVIGVDVADGVPHGDVEVKDAIPVLVSEDARSPSQLRHDPLIVHQAQLSRIRESTSIRNGNDSMDSQVNHVPKQ